MTRPNKLTSEHFQPDSTRPTSQSTAEKVQPTTPPRALQMVNLIDFLSRARREPTLTIGASSKSRIDKPDLALQVRFVCADCYSNFTCVELARVVELGRAKFKGWLYVCRRWRFFLTILQDISAHYWSNKVKTFKIKRISSTNCKPGRTGSKIVVEIVRQVPPTELLMRQLSRVATTSSGNDGTVKLTQVKGFARFW